MGEETPGSEVEAVVEAEEATIAIKGGSDIILLIKIRTIDDGV